MAMTCMIRALTADQIDVLFDNPDLVFDVAIDMQDDDTAELLGEPLFEVHRLDKAWDILRFLLIKAGKQAGRSVDDRAIELLWGEIIGEPADFAGPHLREIDDTQEFARFIEPVSADRLISLFDAEELQKERVYLMGREDVGEEDERELREYVHGHYVSLRDYVLKAAAAECGLLLVVN